MRDSNRSRQEPVRLIDADAESSFELWNMRTGNQIASFHSENEALLTVLRLVREHGRVYGSRLALGREDPAGASHLIATSDALVALAERRLPVTQR